MANLSYGGLDKTATYQLDDATVAAIGKELDGAVGKGVTLPSANGTVGFGVEAGSPLFGVILGMDALGLAAIGTGGYFEGVPLAATKPAFGEIGLGVNSTGAVMKLTAGKFGVVVELGDTTATIKL